MSEQQDNPRRSLVVPIVVALAAVLVFAGAVYALDGVGFVSDFLGLSTETEAVERDPGEAPTEPVGLQLPDGMSEEFALRIWQEQLDSQKNIMRLVNGEIERIVVTDADQDGDEAVLTITAEFEGGESLDGRVGMRKFGENWYFAYVSGLSAGAQGEVAGSEEPTSTLPALEDVDIPLLNEMLAQQAESAEVLQEWADGTVREVRIASIVDGTGNRTLKIVMNETDEQATGDVIVVSKSIDGDEKWFIASFTKDAAE